MWSTLYLKEKHREFHFGLLALLLVLALWEYYDEPFATDTQVFYRNYVYQTLPSIISAQNAPQTSLFCTRELTPLPHGWAIAIAGEEAQLVSESYVACLTYC